MSIIGLNIDQSIKYLSRIKWTFPQCEGVNCQDTCPTVATGANSFCWVQQRDKNLIDHEIYSHDFIEYKSLLIR